jgi:predicted transcriptional regulator
MISLSENEMEAMRILWERGKAKPAEIQEQFSWAIDNGTLRSTLVSLVRKKHVSRKQDGKAFYYSARLQKETALQTMMRGIARIFAKGSTQDLVAQLVDTRDITPDDLKVIRDAAAAKSARRTKSNPP